MKKRIIALAAIMILIIATLALTSCGSRTTLSSDIDENGKYATYTANKADEGDFVLNGALIVGEDEQIVIDSQLKKGGMKFELISNEGIDNSEEVPDDQLAVIYTANVSETESQSVWFGAGEYMVRATATEDNTTGTVNIEIKGFDEADGTETAE